MINSILIILISNLILRVVLDPTHYCMPIVAIVVKKNIVESSRVESVLVVLVGLL
jgi:hypothetical protein